MNLFFKIARFVLTCFGAGLLLVSCQYKEIVDAAYPDQLIYLTTAKNGVYAINSLATSNVATTGAYRYLVKAGEKKIIVPIGVFRGGLSTDGEVVVSIAANTDTINKLIVQNTVLANTAALPSDKFAFPTSVTIPSGETLGKFDLSLDLDYLRANPTKKLALGITIASTQKTVNPLLKTTVISFDPSILIPAPNFTSKANDATVPRKISFTNTSANALTYSWDFGDGSAAVTDAAPTYTYTKAGTFTVTLTTTGLTGTLDVVKKTATVTVL